MGEGIAPSIDQAAGPPVMGSLDLVQNMGVENGSRVDP